MSLAKSFLLFVQLRYLGKVGFPLGLQQSIDLQAAEFAVATKGYCSFCSMLATN
jgi:hypothetical protein